MPSEVKELLTRQLSVDLEGVDNLVLADASRLTAEQNHALRGKLQEAGVTMRVVKNRLVIRACREAGNEALTEAIAGPTALFFEGGGASEIARLLKNWNRRSAKVEIKGGLMEGEVGSQQEVEAWADLPTRPELLSMILGVIISPATGFAGALNASISQFAGCLVAHIEKLEKE